MRFDSDCRWSMDENNFYRVRSTMQRFRLARSQGIRVAIATALLFALGAGLASRVRGEKVSADMPARPTVYQPVGAPADPKVPARWNRYHTHAEATELLKALAKEHADVARLESLGKSYGDREMWVLTIADPAGGKEEDRPAFWIDGGIHANEIQSVEVVLYTAWYLLEARRHSPLVQRLLRERVFYLMPMMSPDSRDAHMQRPNTTSSPRGGQRPVDDDRDGRVDEDGPDDLDDDGHITEMRVADPNGRWKPHPDYPELMIRAQPDEKGQYTLLGAEGIDNDGDGRVNEDGDGYYDPNRDWAWQWQPRYIQSGAFRYPFSVPENRLVADFITAHPHIAGAQSYHNTGGMILFGPGPKSEQFPRSDVQVYEEIARQGELMLPGYRKLNVGTELYEVYGGEFDWLHAMRGIFAFTNELFTPENLFRKPNEGGGFVAGGEDVRAFNKYLLLGDGVVPWHEVDHPQYGKIEVGGLKKTWLRQPPSFLLEEECHRNMAFTLYHADQMPLVAVESIQVRPLAGGLSEVTATITNNRLTPTHNSFDVKHKINPADRVTISAGEKPLEVLTALVSDDPLLRQTIEQKRDPATVLVDNIPGMQAVYVRWIVAGEGPFHVDVHSVKGGRASKSSMAEPDVKK